MTELISVIVPVYKVEDCLERCIDSILDQTYSNFELILVNDGSPDNCGSICERYAAVDNRIKVIHQENQGVSQARNVGIEIALKNDKSRWITFVDSDDWIQKDYLKLLYDVAKTTNSKVSVCEYLKTSEECIKLQNDEFNIEMITPEKMIRKHRSLFVVVWGKLYKKELFTDIRYPIGKIHEDEFVTWKILFKVEIIPVIQNKLYIYYHRSDSIMHSKWNIKHLDAQDAFEEQLKYFKKNGYEKVLVDTAAMYILFLAQCIENINRYYRGTNTSLLKRRLKELYTGFYNKINLSREKKIIIWAMIAPLNLNVIPRFFRKKNRISKSYRTKK